MVNIVVVSHSKRLAEGVAELAQQMVQDGCRIAVAAGVDDEQNPIGTDAIKVMTAIEEVDTPSGVLVMMDLGSALLSAETALELLDPEIAARVLLSSAPLVEGTLAAVVTASSGASLQQVEAEACGALGVKRSQLNPQASTAESEVLSQAAVIPDTALSSRWVVRNAHGLHVRPAAALAQALSGFDAEMQVEKEGHYASPHSVNQLAGLQVRQGDTLCLHAWGAQAGEAIAAFQQLAHNHFGEALPDVADTILSGKLVAAAAINAAVVRFTPTNLLCQRQSITASQIDQEKARLLQAIAASVDELETLAAKTQQLLGADMADIFSAHALLLGDEELVQAMETRITVDQQNAESALYDELMVMANAYLAMEDSYLRVRELDVRDILQRALRHLQDQSPQLPVIAEPCILVADELFPSQVIALSQPYVKAICLAQGSVLSHSAILARAAAIPMMVAADKVTELARTGQQATLDFASATLTLR